MKILVLNGPNLNLLGIREEDVYGSETLEEIELKLKKIVEESECELNFFQKWLLILFYSYNYIYS